MSKRDPHVVLGVPPDASQAVIKAAWRKLARQHHPDVAGSEPVAARAATRRMAEINAAYEQLRAGDADGRRGTGVHRGRPSGADPDDGRSQAAEGHPRPGGAPPPPLTRPVTARLDTSGTLHPRNAIIGSDGRRSCPPLTQAPVRMRSGRHEARRASEPNGPLIRTRVARFRPPSKPSLAVARVMTVTFGKFHGHTLEEIAMFEPSYVDWLAEAVGNRDPDVAAAARVVRSDLDARAVLRQRRPIHTAPSSSGSDVA